MNSRMQSEAGMSASSKSAGTGAHLQRMTGSRPLWQNETRKLDVFGSFLGSFYTGEMRSSLDSKQILLFALGIWVLLLFLMKWPS
jgi:hypothetical protein